MRGPFSQHQRGHDALLRQLAGEQIEREVVRDVGELQRHVEILLELAAIVERPDRALIGQRRLGQHVLAA